MQLLTVWWVPQQLLQKAVFDTFSFEGGWGGSKNPQLGRTHNIGEKSFFPNYEHMLGNIALVMVALH